MAAIQHKESPLVLLHLIPLPTTSAASLPKIEYSGKMQNAGQPDLPYFPTALQNAQMPRRARCLLAFTLLKRALSD
jgi:hypothetical protein